VSRKYLLPCPCGRKVPIEAAQAGQRIRCQCGADLDVPTMLGLSKLEELVQPDGASGSPKHAWGMRQAMPLLGGLILLSGLGGLTWLWATWPEPLDMLRLNPFDAMGMWDELQQGIGAEPSRPERWYSAALAWHLRWLVVAGALALAGLVLIGSGFLIKPRRPEEAPSPDQPAPPNRAAGT
jgi:hypothetical protein